mgnify:CR=1 FL=1
MRQVFWKIIPVREIIRKTRKLKRDLLIGDGLIDLLINGVHAASLEEEFSFNEPSSMQPFAPHYKNHILPHVKKFDGDRINALQIFRKRSIKAISVLIIYLIIFVLMKDIFRDPVYLMFWFTGITSMLVAILGAWAYEHIVKYKSNIKEIIFPKIFQFFGDDYQYNKNSTLTIEPLESSSIIPSHNQRYFEDYVKGSYNDVQLEFVEALLQTHSSGGMEDTSHTVTEFDGIFIILSMNKKFIGKTIVLQDSGKIINKPSIVKGLENAKLEDPVFEKKFEVYSSDQVEARYLLTTSFMERLLDLEKMFYSKRSKYTIKNLQCSFYDNKLLLMIPSTIDRFEVTSPLKPATFVSETNTILKEMEVIFQIINVLKLGQKTGL